LSLWIKDKAMPTQYRTPNLTRRAFARTNRQTITQRVALLQELLPDLSSIAEICCGDCSQQAAAYRQHLGIEIYRGLDIHPQIVAANQAQGVDCICGDALDPEVLRQFLIFEVIFFGPPLSVGCDGHHLLNFDEIIPSYADFVQLLLGTLNYYGTLVCICPKTTTMGDINRLYHRVKRLRPEFGLRLIHYSEATLTGAGETTEPRLKYVEAWFSDRLEERWEVRAR
jgi:hypothetical protein